MMSIPLRFDVHVACINAATNIDEFVRANELAVLDKQYANLSTSVPCFDRRLICMRRYGEPVDMAIYFDANDSTGPSAGLSSVSAVSTISAVNNPTISNPAVNTPTTSSSTLTATAPTTTTAATTPSTVAARTHAACSGCRRKKQRCERPSGTGSCNRCLRARGGPAVCSLAQG